MRRTIMVGAAAVAVLAPVGAAHADVRVTVRPQSSPVAARHEETPMRSVPSRPAGGSAATRPSGKPPGTCVTGCTRSDSMAPTASVPAGSRCRAWSGLPGSSMWRCSSTTASTWSISGLPPDPRTHVATQRGVAGDHSGGLDRG